MQYSQINCWQQKQAWARGMVDIRRKQCKRQEIQQKWKWKYDKIYPKQEKFPVSQSSNIWGVAFPLENALKINFCEIQNLIAMKYFSAWPVVTMTGLQSWPIHRNQSYFLVVTHIVILCDQQRYSHLIRTMWILTISASICDQAEQVTSGKLFSE